jgi:molybdopterin/thiamine biosynthesis adenylyltransferase
MTGIAVIGLGGLGSPVALALARSGVARLGLFDGDEVEVHNLPRQTLFAEGDLGRPKAVVAAERIAELAPGLAIVARAGRVGPQRPDLLSLLDTFPIWVDATDSLESKLWFNDRAVSSGAVLIHGGAIRFSGQALLIAPGHGPCLRCLIEPDETDGAETCSAEGIAGPAVGVVGSLMAQLALQAAFGTATPGRYLHFDALRGVLREWTLPRRAGCPVCRVLGSAARQLGAGQPS